MPPATPNDAAGLGFGRLFGQIRDAVVVSDARGRIVLWNPAAESIFGYTPDEAIGQEVSILVPARYRARHDAGIRRFRESGHGPLVDAGTILELPALCRSGEEKVVEMRLSRVDAGGTFVMAILRDVTERVSMASAMEVERNRLRDANDALEAFSYVVGHDLKEPVRAVAAYLEEGDVANATRANERLMVLLDGLLEWSRASVGGIDRVPVSIDEVVHAPACQTRYQRALETRRATLSVQGEFRSVLGTQALLCQTLGNLILNAIRHNPAERPSVTLLQGAPRDGLVPTIVRDNGPGFPEPLKRRVSRHDPQARGGFGLTIAKRAVDSLGGRLELTDAPGGGGEARVWLPLAQPGDPRGR